MHSCIAEILCTFEQSVNRLPLGPPPGGGNSGYGITERLAPCTSKLFVIEMFRRVTPVMKFERWCVLRRTSPSDWTALMTGQIISFSFLRARTFTTLEAGLAEIMISSPVAGFRPGRALVAGLLCT